MFSKLVALLLVQQIVALPSCDKPADCPNNAYCSMPDWDGYARMWPPCPGSGSCVCNSGFVAYDRNNTCMPWLTVNELDARCSDVWIQVTFDYLTCRSGRVQCASGYKREVDTCTLIPVPVVISPSPNVPAPVVVVNVCQTVGWSDTCDRSKKTTCCNSDAGLTCQKPGRANCYECRCSDRTDIYDQSLGRCRPRIYGDECVADSDCNSGLISNRGFECRYQRCRCSSGYEPYTSTRFDDATQSTTSMRICISQQASTWVPTGKGCTVDPHRWADSSNTKVCHPNAFCHQCHQFRKSYTGTERRALGGTCREVSCSGDSDCNNGNQKNQGRCNNWNMVLDPPCTTGMCDCQWQNGFYKDRFSRCNAYRMLRLGDRCIVPDGSNQLHAMYLNDEDWGDGMECVPNDQMTLGYTDFHNGIVKCKLPLVEDLDGNCVANDQNRNPWTVLLSYDAACDDGNDLCLPIRICDASLGLRCINKKCSCSTGNIPGSCSLNFGGCSTRSATTTKEMWDGSTCRPVRVADACDSNNDCCGGVCNNGACGCAVNFAPVSYSVMSGGPPNHGGNQIARKTIDTVTRCFQNYTIVGQGSECHLNPDSWDCSRSKQYGFYRQWLPTQVCGDGLVCSRCPIDPEPFDQNMGLCRAVNPSGVQDSTPVPANINPLTGALIPPAARQECPTTGFGNGYGYGYGDASQLAASLVLSVLVFLF